MKEISTGVCCGNFDSYYGRQCPPLDFRARPRRLENVLTPFTVITPGVVLVAPICTMIDATRTSVLRSSIVRSETRQKRVDAKLITGVYVCPTVIVIHHGIQYFPVADASRKVRPANTLFGVTF